MSSVGFALIGKFFRTFDAEKNPQFRGWILSRPEPEIYLCQLVNWDGDPSCEKLESISAMSRWAFYSSEDEWLAGIEGNKNHSKTLSDSPQSVPINSVFSRRLETER